MRIFGQQQRAAGSQHGGALADVIHTRHSLHKAGGAESSGHSAQLSGRIKADRPAVAAAELQQAGFVLFQINAGGGGNSDQGQICIGAERCKRGFQLGGGGTALAANA